MATPYNTMTEALDDLFVQGFTCDFNLITIDTYNLDTYLPIDDFMIMQTIRFENDSDPAESAILYAIVSEKHHLKGTLVNGFGIYANPLTDSFINSIFLQNTLT